MVENRGKKLPRTRRREWWQSFLFEVVAQRRELDRRAHPTLMDIGVGVGLLGQARRGEYFSDRDRRTK